MNDEKKTAPPPAIPSWQIYLVTALPPNRPKVDEVCIAFARRDLLRLATELRQRAANPTLEAIRLEISPQGFLLQVATRGRPVQ